MSPDKYVKLYTWNCEDYIKYHSVYIVDNQGKHNISKWVKIVCKPTDGFVYGFW